MRGIFISYRRDDSEGQAGRLFDDLSAHFGRNAIFMDVAGIKKGLDFRRIIDAHVASCGVLLVIIGKRWLSAADSKGKRRLDDVNDFVRLETAAALSRDIPVVPVLVQDAVMPSAQELPDALKELAFRNGTELTHARWDSDVKLLIEDIRPYLEKPATARTCIAADARESSVATPRSTPPEMTDGCSAARCGRWEARRSMVGASRYSVSTFGKTSGGAKPYLGRGADSHRPPRHSAGLMTRPRRRLSPSRRPRKPQRNPTSWIQRQLRQRPQKPSLQKPPLQGRH